MVSISMKKMLTCAVGAAGLFVASPLAAQVVLSHQEINTEVGNEGKVYTGALGCDGVSVTIVSKESYRISMPGYQDIVINYKMARAGGRRDGNPTINGTVGGYEVRVEWLNRDQAKLQIWEAGKRAGQTQNNPALFDLMVYAD